VGGVLSMLLFFQLAQGGMPGTDASGMSTSLYSPDHWVVCNRERAICYDRYGPSIGLTQAFLGEDEADRLTAVLRAAPLRTQPEAVFSVADDVVCRREIGPCFVQGVPDAELTSVLFGPRPSTDRQDLERSLVGVAWQWQESRYSNDTHVEPSDPAHYVLYLENTGRLRLRADCNSAGGQYRLEGRTLAVEIGPITRAACEPGSLDTVFLRDLSAVFGIAVDGDHLFLDIQDSNGIGTMQFGR
jgi:heat shock protein HslJ